MKRKTWDLIKMDINDKTGGDGFVMYGSSSEDSKEPIRPSINKEQQNFSHPYNDQYNNQYNNQTNNEKKKSTKTKKPMSSKTKNILIIVLALILGVSGGFGGGYLAVSYFGNGGSSNTTINSSSNMGTTEAVAEKVLPSVVGITATTTQVSQDYFWGQQEQEVSGVGTGIIVDEAGYILTNSHVVLDSEDTKLTVLLSDSSEVSGTVKWLDATLDLAIVKINAKDLTAVELGNSDKINIGQYVAAIGNPLGLDFQGSVTQGVVSGLNRTITASSDNKEVTMEGLIQVDAAINSGNSGGPLLNDKGEVIGINTAKASGEGMGFAIPINSAKPIIDSIKETGEFSRVYMGITVGDISEVVGESSGDELGTDTGAYIVSVTNGSPAEEGGLKAKDIIVEVDSKKVETKSELINILLNYKSGDEITVKYYRGGKAGTAKVKLTDEAQG